MTSRFVTRGAAVLALSWGLTALPAAQTPPKTAPPAPAKPATAKAPAVKPGLPAAVADAFKKAYPNAVIKNWAKETEGGKVQYEIESMDGAQARDINYAADGTVLVMEEALPTADLPAAVSAAVAKTYPKATITKVERVTKGKETQYEVFLKGAKVPEALFSPDGKPIK